MTAPTHDTSADTEKSTSGSAEPAVARKVEGRSLGRIAWTRLKQDKLALAGGIVVALLILVAVFAPLIVSLFGHPPNQFNQDKIDPLFGTPKGAFGGISGEHLLGVEPNNGRDVFSRIVYGARISLLVAFLAALLAVVLGTVLGVVAGYFGGWVDAVISRVMDMLLSFPQLLFIISLVAVLPNDLFGLTGSSVRITILVCVIGFFGWPNVGRIVRGQTLSLREKEYVEAARSLGAGRRYVLFKELLPNLVAPITVYATLMIPTNILTEAALSYLGAGVRPPTASWGQMLSTAVDTYESNPTFMVVPGLAIFVTVLAFNLFGDGVRDALDPKGTR
ncbi:ABC transporter permease [Streptomyces clavuligerus]|uniref:Oligopeptide transport integral membrane protein n=1 Tax=Streptomyces clavuligerus TaxID=1901 RepID=B5GVG1_STRCL|nr:ABC transporter permease [Streptomyces clavuligerus]ANW17956.1 peptide ABC transporter permease [Streptomyces clavuligerus]AXU12517.1 ABC transporter permease [Streptomyces clavuligerus]EDY50307.1 oligopeptide transport integral membrane protein [Streptomyces clavuligerus]EFG09476.1 oligopeptide transport integral membrane protein [Streptomyces clavuligerus]MBY6302412.1 ABC transporter permease [Streptomyces clavuligerus]